MQSHPFLKNTTYRSFADKKLIIDDKQAVLTITANKKAPYQAILFLEILHDTKKSYDLHEISYLSKAEYGDRNAFKYSQTSYGFNGPGIFVVQTSHYALETENKLCFAKAIPREKALSIYSKASTHSHNYDQHPDQYLKISSLDFCRNLLTEAKILNNNEEFILTYVPKKNYPKKILVLWEQHATGLSNPPIDTEKESTFAAKLLPLSSQILPLTPEARLQLFFKTHVDRSHPIHWNSEEGQSIQFLQDRLGLLVFCYNKVLPYYLEKNISLILPTVLVGLICKYALEKDQRAYYPLDDAPKSKCLMM